VTTEIPKIVQQTGSGTASSIEAVAGGSTVDGAAGGAVTTGAAWIFAAGAVINGCVFVIFTVGAGRRAGSGRMLMRAVSFFGPACAAEPG
jgi:hypothetical protein